LGREKDQYKQVRQTVDEFMLQDPTKSTPLNLAKFIDPDRTAKGELRASVKLGKLETLWFNTGTLCNIECANCYIESSPRNDRLAYISTSDLTTILDEAIRLGQSPAMIGFTGGEPFMNPAFPDMLEETLSRGHNTLILTNAMKPMMRPRVQARLDELRQRFPEQITLRISLDHWQERLHDEERGDGTFQETLEGIRWLRDRRFNIAIAGRLRWGDAEHDMRTAYATLFSAEHLLIDAWNPEDLVLFPEMDASADVPEITVDCWRILNKSPNDMMCASSRMVVKHQGKASASIIACTLLPYDPQFDLGPTLKGALGTVKLNHPHCAKFCVLGGGNCKA
jgi:uncharacterized Fe-S cluster-containing radical SAM superfamily protein